MADTEDSEIIDIINIKAHKRIIRRHKYKRGCRCKVNRDPQIITAPLADRLIPKSRYGISIWAHVLLQKYEHQQPLQRVLESLTNHGLDLPVSTIVGGLQKLLPTLTPTTKEQWALDWVDLIATLYHLNNERLKQKQNTQTFHEKDTILKKHVKKMKKIMKAELKAKDVCYIAKKILISLQGHWEGLTLFVDNPGIPMDNNTAERSLRASVVGRKNYYGSGSIWSAELSAVMFSLFKTLKLWNINPHTWLLAYFHECAANAGKPPDNIDRFLPWKMKPELKTLLSSPPLEQVN